MIYDPPSNSEVGFNAAANYVYKPSTKTGGTLRLLAGSDCDSWDPGRTELGWCWNLQRLITRTLVGFRRVDGTDVKLGPDLATSLGKHNSNYTRWTFTLQPGLEFANGEPITPRDIKYGIDRLFADSVVRTAIDSIATTSDSITFTLSHPDADFDYLLALPAAAPVPVGEQPVASGPFEIRSHTKKSVVFVRNPYWRQGTDGIRHPLVDSVRLRIELRHPDDIDRQLEAGRADARADYGVLAAFRSQILRDRKLKADADDPVLAATRYLAVVPSVIPNVHCRRAIFYAFDKAAAIRAMGGPTAGVPAMSMTPPGIEGYDPSFDPYPSGPRETGDIARAKHELGLCGKPHGFTAKMYFDTPSETGPRVFAAEHEALHRVGIKIVAAPVPITGTYIYDTPRALEDEGIGLVEGTATSDYPSASAFYEPLVRNRTRYSRGLLPPGLGDPAIQRVLLDARQGRASEPDWDELDRAVMSDAVYLPFSWAKELYYRNPRLTNIDCDAALAYGIYDFVNVGVR